jgi:glycosyltransferase involved in cell wall biosynthesis
MNTLMPSITHLTTVHQPFDTRIFHKECRSLAQAGYRVFLVARHTQSEIIDGVEIVPLPHYSNRFLRMLLGTVNAYRLARSTKAEIYHLHDPELLLVGLLLKWTASAKVVYDVHENHQKKMLAREWMHPMLRKPASWGVGIIERLTVPFFDALVCVTEHIAGLFPKVKRAIVVKNYPPLQAISAPTGSEQYTPDNQRLIYTGGWTDHRGVYQIVQALEYVRHPHVRLTLLGRCIDPHVQKNAERLPGYARVDYHGLVPFQETLASLHTSAIGLVCNQPVHDYDLAQPNKLFEYMAAGLPVIASGFPLWQEVVEGHQCGLTVDPTQPRQIAQAIDTLLANPELRAQMGANGREAALSSYNWAGESQKLLTLYEDLLKL